MKIQMKNLSMTYNTGRKALQNINLSLESPCLLGLLGPNGAGKSTLMKLLVARILQTSGDILVNNKRLSDNEKYLKGKLGYLPQDFGLYDELTVKQFLSYIATLKEINNNPKKVINDVIISTNLGEKKNSKIRTLSGGQRQRVGIAQALLGCPELLIFDEPTTGLDPEERVSFRNLFSQNASDKIVILSTHIIEDIQSICNRLVVINQGIILFNGTPNELIETAKGHVGVIQAHENINLLLEHFKITSRLFYGDKVEYRIVGEELPKEAKAAEPSLEDAYMFLMSKEDTNEVTNLDNK